MATKRQTPTIVMTPPAHLGAAASSSRHPRRPPAEQSVSLVRSPRHRAPPTKDNDSSESSSDSQDQVRSKATDGKTSDGSPSSLQPLGRDSSGESSNAEKWFDKSNNDVRGNGGSFADNDPPFFMRNSSSSETPPEVQLQQMRKLLGNPDGSGNLPLRANLLHLGTDGSSTEDFRSVIDDLTVENKKLKRKLKKYEKLQDSHLKDEKLFEVRIHGLPAHKKRELEETLRNFAASLGPNGVPTSGYERIPTMPTKQTASSQNTDSAYASMSASGQGSSARSGPETLPQRLVASAAQRHQNIHSYLHHIPEGLLPQQNPATMSERAKKKLVVRRLEQVFAGKGAAIGGHQHPMQQQEVSQMAAQADRDAGEAQGQRQRLEGIREARILRDKINSASAKHDGAGTTPQDEALEEKQPKTRGKRSEDAMSDGTQNDQRPTRPLDLDLYRAQVPADNIKYMRHLGFSPLDPDAANSPEEGHGWLYLNLLINMAQLHTINVTPDFIRKALTEHSNKFELSHDGRKVRWRGGSSVTRGSSSGETSSYGRTENATPDGRNPRKRPKLSHRDSGRSTDPSAGPRAGQQESNRMVYTPLFFHKSSIDGTEDSSEEEEEDDSMSSPWNAPVQGDSSGMTSSGMHTTTSRKKRAKRDDGPIIFYNNARFCTDLSGDRNTNGNANAPPYNTATSIPVGKPNTSGNHKDAEKRGPLARASELPEAKDLSDSPIGDALELTFPVQGQVPAPDHAHIKLFEMEASGIGGVYPADNFAIAVKNRRVRRHQPVNRSTSGGISTKLAQVLRPHNSKRHRPVLVQEQIVAMAKKDLPPSDLPDALTYVEFDDSNGDDESDFDDAMSVSPASPGALPPATAPQPVELHYTSSEDQSHYEDDDDFESDDGSLDLLAAAREIDPEAIREQERAYDAQCADRLAQEIPPGSSAATAGGGSGFASPSSNMNREEYEKAVKAARAKQNRPKKTDGASMQARNSKVITSSANGSDAEDEEMEG